MSMEINYIEPPKDKLPKRELVTRPGDEVIDEPPNRGADVGQQAGVAEVQFWKKQAEESRESEEKNEINVFIENKIGLDSKRKRKAFQELLLFVDNFILQQRKDWKMAYSEKSVDIVGKSLDEVLNGCDILDKKEEQIFNALMNNNGIVSLIEEVFGKDAVEDILKKAIRVNRDTRISSTVRAWYWEL